MSAGTFFKDRSAKERLASEEQSLIELLASRELRGYVRLRQCEIGPFVVEHVFPVQCLIVELMPGSLVPGAPSTLRHEARLKFLNDMGYDVLSISPQELTRQRERVLARLRRALSRS